MKNPIIFFRNLLKTLVIKKRIEKREKVLNKTPEEFEKRREKFIKKLSERKNPTIFQNPILAIYDPWELFFKTNMAEGTQINVEKKLPNEQIDIESYFRELNSEGREVKKVSIWLNNVEKYVIEPDKKITEPFNRKLGKDAYGKPIYQHIDIKLEKNIARMRHIYHNTEDEGHNRHIHSIIFWRKDDGKMYMGYTHKRHHAKKGKSQIALREPIEPILSMTCIIEENEETYEVKVPIDKLKHARDPYFEKAIEEINQQNKEGR